MTSTGKNSPPAPERSTLEPGISWRSLAITFSWEKDDIQNISVTYRPDENEAPFPSSRTATTWLNYYWTSSKIPREVLTFNQLTEFTRDVLLQALVIPLGETWSYGKVSNELNRDTAPVAVGQALKKNPYPIIIPCHRVIRSSGELGGYGGQNNNPVKKYLLELENDFSHR
ncbi:MAG: methylated-DNA--[protein]-cysteine S-methyltransferase [bacterium]